MNGPMVTNRTLDDVIELICACWVLGEGGEDRLDMRGDRFASMIGAVSSDLPAWTRDHAEIVSRYGRCQLLDADRIIARAQDLALLSFDGSTFTRAAILLDDGRARQIAIGAGLSTETAKRLGSRMRQEMASLSPERSGDSPGIDPGCTIR